MANRLADLNRSRRDYAYSGRANVGDVPYLYALQAEQAEANRPAGIGGGGSETQADGAPNPLAAGVASAGGSGGGGSSGGADTGLSGPGQTGLGEDFDQFYRDYYGGGGQAGEPGGAGAGGIDYGPSGYFADPTFPEYVGYFGPGPIGLVGSVAAAGMRGYNAGVLGDILSDSGLRGIGGWQQIGAALGLNNYGTYDYEEQKAILNDRLEEAGYDRVDTQTQGGVTTATAPSGEIRGAFPSSPTGIGTSSTSSSYSAGSGLGGGGAEGGSRAGGQSGANVGGERSERGTSTYHSGGYVSEDNVPGMMRGDVPATLQEGEGVLTADAMQILGPGFLHGVNMMARMMANRR